MPSICYSGALSEMLPLERFSYRFLGKHGETYLGHPGTRARISQYIGLWMLVVVFAQRLGCRITMAPDVWFPSLNLYFWNITAAVGTLGFSSFLPITRSPVKTHNVAKHSRRWSIQLHPKVLDLCQFDHMAVLRETQQFQLGQLQTGG